MRTNVLSFVPVAEDFLVEADLLPNVGHQFLLLTVAVVEESLVVFDLVVNHCVLHIV